MVWRLVYLCCVLFLWVDGVIGVYYWHEKCVGGGHLNFDVSEIFFWRIDCNMEVPVVRMMGPFNNLWPPSWQHSWCCWCVLSVGCHCDTSCHITHYVVWCVHRQASDYVGSADLGSAYNQTSAGSELPASGQRRIQNSSFRLSLVLVKWLLWLLETSIAFLTYFQSRWHCRVIGLLCCVLCPYVVYHYVLDCWYVWF